MIGTLLASALLMGSDPGSLPALQSQPQQTPPAVTQTDPDQITLEGIDVVGRPLDELIRGFVNEVARPNNGRSLARWDAPVCVGVANLQRETAEYLADRISTVADDLGLRVGDAGCAPNLLVVATADGAGMAQELAEEHRRTLRPGGAGMDAGTNAFRDFQTADRPVRWWQVVLPTDSETGNAAVRIPGECYGMCTGDGSAFDYAPKTYVFAASRLSTQIVENIIRTVVIVDVDDVAGLTALQLADYIAMVTLAQIDPEAEIGSYASILNVFDNPAAADSLTNWDLAYLQGLYASERSAVNVRANHAEVANTIEEAHRRLRREAEEAEEDPASEGQGVSN